MPTAELEKEVDTQENQAPPTPAPRVLYPDVLRCVAITCVVLLHSIGPLLSEVSFFGTNSWNAALALNPFCRIGVPLFLMISGHLLLNGPETASMWGFYKKRLPRIFYPLLAWNIIYYLFYVYVQGKTGINYREHIFNSGMAYHMWYVYTLLGIYLIAPFLKKITDTCTKLQVTGFFILIISLTTIRPFINFSGGVYVYLSEPLMQGYLGYFILGYLLGSANFSTWQRIVFYVGGAAGYALNVLFIYTRSTAEALDFSINNGYALPTFLLAAAVFVLVKRLFGKSSGESSAAQTVSRCAGLTFGIYWVHALVLEELEIRLTVGAVPIVEALVRFVFALLISAVIIAVISKIKSARKYLM